IGRDKNLFGEISYMHTLTSTFAPRTPELLRQEMAKNLLQGTTLNNGSQVSLTLSDGTVATLNLIGDSAGMVPTSTNPFSGTKYSDANGNTWSSNGDGTYSLQSASEQQGSFFAGWGQIAHDIYQQGAVRNMTGTIAVMPVAQQVFNLPISFMTNYIDNEGNIQAGRLTLTSFSSSDHLATTGLSNLSIENNFGNLVYSQTTQNQKIIDKGNIEKSFSGITGNYWAKGFGAVSYKENIYYDNNSKEFKSNREIERISSGELSKSIKYGLDLSSFSSDPKENLQFDAEFLRTNGIAVSAGDGTIYLPGKPMEGVQLLVGGTSLTSAFPSGGIAGLPSFEKEGRVETSVVANNVNGQMLVSGWAYHSDNPYFNNIGINGVKYTNENLASTNLSKAAEASKAADNNNYNLNQTGGLYRATMVNNNRDILFDLTKSGTSVQISNNQISNNGLVMSQGDRVYGHGNDYLTGIGSDSNARKLRYVGDNGSYQFRITSDGNIFGSPTFGDHGTISGFGKDSSSSVKLGVFNYIADSFTTSLIIGANKGYSAGGGIVKGFTPENRTFVNGIQSLTLGKDTWVEFASSGAKGKIGAGSNYKTGDLDSQSLMGIDLSNVDSDGKVFSNPLLLTVAGSQYYFTSEEVAAVNPNLHQGKATIDKATEGVSKQPVAGTKAVGEKAADILGKGETGLATAGNKG
ncbi:MAG: hypothetical protein KJ710_05970, partial [Candidatus Omnitrophica bacterium]|nr:hypothetical protein [Candidatus Omnitrophota bacterium]